MKRAVFALFSLAIASLGWAQSGEQVEAPSFKPGDSWTYVRSDAMDSSRTAKYVVTIKSVSESGHETSRQALEGTVSGSGDQFTSEMNPIVLEDQKYEPYIPVFSFPLTPGKKWDGTYSFLGISGLRVNVARANRVEGWETVKTAAGEFKALKITFSGRVLAGRGNSFHGTSWYSPEVRRVVLSEFKQFGVVRDQRVELVSFKPAQ